MKAQTTLVACIVALFIIGVYHHRSTDSSPMSDYKLYEVKQRILPVDREAVQSVEFFEASSSYTENKKDIYLCLRDPSNGKYYDINTLTYVALHELAHVKTESLHHSEEFKSNFRRLLKKAEKLGIYNPQWPLAPVYCGVKMHQ